MNDEFIKNLITQDLAHIWHPCSQMKDYTHFPPLPIKRGEGVYLEDFGGKKYIDCISSWWVNLFGHNHPYISQKLKEQIDCLEHTIFAGYTYEGIIRFSARLVSKLPKVLNKVFYADNGSSAIEVALKMSYHLGLLRGNPKSAFLSLENSYHGETIGALSVGDVELYKKTYENILIENIQAPLPVDSSVEAVDSALNRFAQILDENEICAFVIEPLVQCAGEMRMYPAKFVKGACELARERGIAVIFDEIAVGFGRTGEMFALEICNFVPDFLCLSKGITGGYLPLSAVITSDCIYGEFLGDINRAFLHSHSYTGNPLAVACANAVLDLFERENIVEKNKILSDFIWDRFLELGDFKFVKNLRRTGMIFAFEVDGEFDLKGRFSLEVSKIALREGLILRPLGRTIYFMPPYIISKDEVKCVVSGIANILKSVDLLKKV